MPLLLIDSYDSFTFNLSTLIEKVTGQRVVTIRNDSVSGAQLREILPLFDAVVVGPGPGSPANPSDIGVLADLWTLESDQLVPVFGVCLGFQSLVVAHGGEIHRLELIKHGQIGHIGHTGSGIFKGVPQDFPSIRYHSLHVKNIPDCIEVTARIDAARDPDDPEEVIMGGHHKTKPFYGVQYHPESICSKYGAEVLSNFWGIAQEWSRKVGRTVKADVEAFRAIEGKYSIKPLPLVESKSSETAKPSPILYKLANTKLSPADICTRLGANFVLLNSAAPPGQRSIIGVLEPGVTNVITHYTDYRPDYGFISKWQDNSEGTSYDSQLDRKEIQLSSTGIWGLLAKYMAPKIAKFKNTEIPAGAKFVGGLIGYFTYEASVEAGRARAMAVGTPGVSPRPGATPKEHLTADVNLIDVERCILLDHELSTVHVVSTKAEDEAWVDSMTANVESFAPLESTPTALGGNPPEAELPVKEEYISKIQAAKEFLKSGDSYELCLTGPTKLTFDRIVDPWTLYRVLLHRNPAPYSCFMNMADAILVGSSPERFMSWNREGVCEFRPIKGTVKKGPTMTRQRAEEILNTPKELAENLMIVDLIRHDLNQILHNVRAEKLMSVEEYTSVYQLVSVIQGDLPAEYLGIDILGHSLPPGSMTGAPKLRSVDILRNLEEQVPRGIYSGVSGYWSVLDEGDWSVVIRSAFNYKSDPFVWRIGAGGAITILSDDDEEWDEMITKLQTALQAFV